MSFRNRLALFLIALVVGIDLVAGLVTYKLINVPGRFDALIVPVFVILGLSVAAAIGGAYFIARSISRPLETLAKTARRIGEGNYSPPPRIGRRDEIGQLSRALGGMAEAIKGRQLALEFAISSLEIARDDAVRANEGKSKFLANMSHELRTPLNAVIGFSEIIAGEIMGRIANRSYVGYAEDILTSGKHLLEIVEEMLDLARVESGTYAISPVPVNPREILKEAMDMLRNRAADARIQMRVEVGTPLWPDLVADRVKLRQVFVNLLANAIAYTPEGGSVTVSGTIEADTVVIRFADTGIGMRDEDIPLVVQPFYRVHSPQDAKYQGIGLGLPLCNAIVALHGGTLVIESELGRGTTITVRLPIGDVEGTDAALSEGGTLHAMGDAA
jgi:signal transduction histidine kinase